MPKYDLARLTLLYGANRMDKRPKTMTDAELNRLDLMRKLNHDASVARALFPELADLTLEQLNEAEYTEDNAVALAVLRLYLEHRDELISLFDSGLL